MNKVRATSDHAVSIIDTRTFLTLFVCVLSAAGVFFFGGANDSADSSRTDSNHSINYSHGVYTLTGDTGLTLDDEYSNDSESRKTCDTSRAPVGSTPLFALTHPFSQSEDSSRNIFHPVPYSEVARKSYAGVEGWRSGT